MPNKFTHYTNLSNHTLKQISGSYEEWISFLITAGRLYKYPFHEQLMIYTQKPDATACAEYDLWNTKMRRYIRRGSKGIALIDTSADNPRLKYVFDISDTGTRTNSRTPFLWSYQEKYKEDIASALKQRYNISESPNITEQIDQISSQLITDYWNDNKHDIIGILANSFLEEYDEYNMEVAFRNAASVSTAYTVMSRCMLNPMEYFEPVEFTNVFDFNTQNAIIALGTAVSSTSEQILRQIETVIKNYERRKQTEKENTYAEQHELYADRRLSDSKPEFEQDRDDSLGQVRSDEKELPSETQTDTVEQHDPVGESISTSDGDRRDSKSKDGTADSGVDETKRHNGGSESQQSDEVDRHDEQSQNPSGRNDSHRTDLQLNEQLTLFDAEMFPTEQEQIAGIDEAESAKPTPFAFSFAQEDIDHVLRLGSNSENSRKVIVSEFQKQKTIEEIAVTLSKEYHGGAGFKSDHGEFSVWYADDGIHLAKGRSARYSKSAQVVSWDTAAERIGQLIEQGEFTSNVEVTEAESYERAKLAEALWYHYGDISDNARAQGHMSALNEYRDGGFPSVTEKLTDKLKDPIFCETLMNELTVFASAYEQNNELMRFRLYNPQRMIGMLQNYSLPRIEYTSKLTEVPQLEMFITEDEINDTLSYSSIAGSKSRIYSYFTADHSAKEKADFLKNEYGTGGRTHAVSQCQGSYEEHSGKGIKLSKRDCTPVELSWNKVVSRYESMIRSGHFFSAEEKSEPVVSIPIDGEWKEFSSIKDAEQASYDEFKADILKNAQNFRITDDHLGEGGAKTKYQANINAIKLLKELESDGRQALPEQQTVLSRYVGWGGLADVFDPDKANWNKEYTELKELLTPEEYTAARSSTLNAHYTSPVVIKAIYEAIENMGFETGNILEPSMGIGNFFGCLPEAMQNSKLYGVELDSITGRIAKQLYPKADITIAGFETTDRRDFYDLAIGNVPFGQYQVNDRAYNKLGFSIHDYFFAKALDQVRPGGVVAFVTSRYTMDKQSPEVRKYIAQRAELLGAIRLPNNAFKANAGTEVVSDIIFLQKRDQPIEIEPDWVHLGKNDDGFAINSYFIDNPEMILGRQTSESTQYGKQDFTVEPYENLDLDVQLKYAIQNIKGTYTEAELPDLGDGEAIDTSIPADPNVKNYGYTVVDGNVYYRENSRMIKPELNATATERVKGMVELRDCVQNLIDQQMDGYISDETIRHTQHELNDLYDKFTAKHGLINSRSNALAFADDSSYYLLCSLEILDEENNLKRKADMFTKKTIRPNEIIATADTAAEALAISISEKACVDMEYMSVLTNKSEEVLASELVGVIFYDPVKREWQTADEYLSGNVREKLRVAQRYAESEISNEDIADYRINVAALEKAQPKDLDASEIEVRLGATWIDKEYIQQFMQETFNPPFYLRRSITVNYSQFTAEWNISGKSQPSYTDVNAYMTYGTDRANAYKILEDTLNLRDVRIYDTVTDPDGTERRVLNSKETTLAQQKQQAIKDAFQDWIWRDPDRRMALVTKYNESFNSNRPREYDGKHITFIGMNPEIKLREHQRNAVAHILYGGNTLLAHEVGAGKTFEMAAAAMESKRLGLCHKPLFAVPNHLTEQWASEFLRLYPSANILAATKKDFEPKNRKKFCARIATGDYDAIIIGHSQFERIPVSAERQERLLQEQIQEIEDGISELKASRAEKFTIKSLERTKKSLEVKLKKLQDSDRKDDVITFEQLGVDRLYVDEAHNYKNLFLYTKMRNVAGLSATDAQKSSDMLLKCRYIDEITDNKGIVFATGTPVSNSMTELYTMMRYLQHDTIKDKGLAHFDCWASTFGETTTAIELAPEGTGYRARTRFAKFFNLPELMNLFKEAADIKTSDQLNLPTPIPIYHNIVAQPTIIQQSMVQDLSERAAKVHAGVVDSSVDNMLKITSDGRKLGLDQRVINPDLPDEPMSKVNICIDNIYHIWDEGQADKLTQLVFCDLSTPKTTLAEKNDDSFTIYDDIRDKLTAKGIPREQIAFIHEANTEVRKKELFSKVRIGQVRVLIGSTFKMGAGMNVQDKLIALHDLDAPWRPGDLEQRSGRIIRQGNTNPEVHIYRYVTEGTFDAYLWQTLENKQKFISQIMTSKSPVRSCDDIDETALSYAEIKALCAGDERIKEKMDLDVDVARLKLMKANHQSQQYRLEDNLLRYFPEQIEQYKNILVGLEADLKTLSNHPHPDEGFIGMNVLGSIYSDRETAGAAIIDTFKNVKGLESIQIGSYRGFQMSLTVEDFGRDYILTLRGQMAHRVSLGKDSRGNLIRIDNALNSISERINAATAKLESINLQMENARTELGKPFPQDEELRTKSARLAELNIELNMDEHKSKETSTIKESDCDLRPSILEKLHTCKSDKRSDLDRIDHKLNKQEER